MFDLLKRTFASLTEAVTRKTLDDKEISKILSSFEASLLESDVALEVVDEITSKVREELAGSKVERSVDSSDYVLRRLSEHIKEIFDSSRHIDLLEEIRAKKEKRESFVAVFLGINGTGKTTTIAKVANMLKKKEGFSLVMACADTHRAGAIEQLSEHASRLSVKVVAQRYGADPGAVARDAVLYAKNHHVDVVLIDTAGRIQTSRNLMEEMAKIVRVVKPDLTVFVGDALAGNDAIYQAKEFLKYTNFNAAILTKADADAKGGSALSIAYVTKRPIIYLGVGQRYDDLIPFKVEDFVAGILGMSDGESIRVADS